MKESERADERRPAPRGASEEDAAKAPKDTSKPFRFDDWASI